MSSKSRGVKAVVDQLSIEDPRVTRTRRDVIAAALEILLKDGWSAVTHLSVAKQSGYSRATIYGHWPNKIDLVRDAFKQYEQMPHSVRTGHLKTDLSAELNSFCDAMVKYGLDRALSMLAEKAQTNAEVVPIRDSFVSAGEQPIRGTLSSMSDPIKIEALTLMLCGMVTHSVLMHGEPPSVSVIDMAVEIALLGTSEQK